MIFICVHLDNYKLPRPAMRVECDLIKQVMFGCSIEAFLFIDENHLYFS